MKHQKVECNCETCKERMRLEAAYPEKEIGLQYAIWDLEKFRLLISVEELPYLQEESKDKPLQRLSKENEKYILAYGVFRSQKEFHQDFFDLHISKSGTYFYFNSEEEQCIEVKIIDYLILSKQKDEAKVCLLLKANDCLPFPRKQEELSVTLSRTMSELGDNISNLVLSRIEYGIFRLDHGKIIDQNKLGHWKKQISSKKCFVIPYKRFLLID